SGFMLLIFTGSLIVFIAVLRQIQARFQRTKEQLETATRRAIEENSEERLAELPNEVKELAVALFESAQQLRKSKEDNIRAKATMEIAAQVSHDIRSPLSALNMIMGTLQSLPEEKRLIIRNATQRINDISNQLLQKAKGDGGNLQTNFASEPIMLVAQVD